MNYSNKDINSLNTCFAQLQEIAMWIREQFAPIIKHQEVLQKSLQPFLAEIAKISEYVIEFQKQLDDIISPNFEKLQKSFRELPLRTQEALLTLGNHSWFFDLEMSFSGLWRLKEALSEGNVEKAENALIEYFTNRLDKIENFLVSKFPYREKVIKAAFRAHKREEYELSIPVFLSQADGICNEVTKQYFFMKQNKKPRTAIYVEETYVEKTAVNIFISAILLPLAQTLPINASKHERNKEFNELNRNMVLHGDSSDYGTKLNSLKSISLINYISQIPTYEKEKSQ